MDSALLFNLVAKKLRARFKAPNTTLTSAIAFYFFFTLMSLFFICVLFYSVCWFEEPQILGLKKYNVNEF